MSEVCLGCLEKEALIEALRNQIWELTQECNGKDQRIRLLEREVAWAENGYNAKYKDDLK